MTEGKILGAFILAATEYEKLYQDNTVLFEKDLAPEYDLESGDEISCPASGSGSTITYQWYKDGVAVEGATSATIAPLHPGNYYCTATANDRTVKTSVANVTVDGETGVVNSLCSYENETLRYENYNIVGQRVKDGYKGIIVKNGKKVLR